MKGISNIFKQNKARKVLMWKDKMCPLSMPSMSELALTIKMNNKLKKLIVQYFIPQESLTFDKRSLWEDIIAKLPILMKLKVLRKCKINGVTNAYLHNMLKMNPSNYKYPEGLLVLFDNFYVDVFGGGSLLCWSLFFSFVNEKLMQTFSTSCIEEEKPLCPLAIVDFSRVEQTQWLEEGISVF